MKYSIFDWSESDFETTTPLNNLFTNLRTMTTSKEMDVKFYEACEKAGIPTVNHDEPQEEGLEEWAKVFFTGREKENDSNMNSSANS